MNLIDLTGRRFGRLTVVSRVPDTNPIKWHCRCDCGHFTDVLGWNLRSGKTTSCGCNRVANIARARSLRKPLPSAPIVHDPKPRKINKNNTSGFPGVYRRGDRFVSILIFHGRQIFLGYFSTAEEAAFARSEAQAKYAHTVQEEPHA